MGLARHMSSDRGVFRDVGMSRELTGQPNLHDRDWATAVESPREAQAQGGSRLGMDPSQDTDLLHRELQDALETKKQLLANMRRSVGAASAR